MQDAYNAAYSRERSKYARDLLAQESGVVRAIASRGLSSFPGFGHSALLDVEIAAKLALGDANFKLIQMFVERDLKRYGVDFDLEFKAARMAFELYKAEVSSDLSRELAELKKLDARNDADVQSWLSEVKMRETILIEARTQLGLEREALKQEIADAEIGVEGERKKVVSERIVAIDAKLEVLPVLLELVAAQSAVVDYSATTMYDEFAKVLIAQRELSNEKTKLLQPSIEKSHCIKDYANKLLLVPPHVSAKAQATFDLSVAEGAYYSTYEVPLSEAYLAYTSEQSKTLPYIEALAAARVSIAHQNTDNARAELEKAIASYALAMKQYDLYDKMDQRSKRLIDEVLPEQKKLVAAMQAAISDKFAASANRVAAAAYKITIAEKNAEAFVIQTQIDVVNSGLDIDRLEYMLGEKQYRVNISVAQNEANAKLIDAKTDYIEAKILAQADNAAAEVSATERSNEYRLEWKKRVPEILAVFQEEYYVESARDRGYEDERTAEIASKAKISSKLIHTIS